MSDTPARAAPPWLTIAIGAVGALATVLGAFMAVGGWRERVDGIDRRLTQVEKVQQTNLPTFYAMTRDLAYLAERARREDERLAREQERRR